MDFWKAESSKPTPLVFFIHGGGWKDNDKNKVTGVKEYLAAGVPLLLGRAGDREEPEGSDPHLDFGLKLQEKLKTIPVECHLMYPGATGVPYPDPIRFLIAKLKAEKP
jgi:hypothetical protein